MSGASSIDHNEIWGCIVNTLENYRNNDKFSIIGRSEMKKASSEAITELARETSQFNQPLASACRMLATGELPVKRKEYLSHGTTGPVGNDHPHPRQRSISERVPAARE